jgi:hypothetical protein
MKKYCNECSYVNKFEEIYCQCQCCEQFLCQDCWEYHNEAFHKDRSVKNGSDQWHGYKTILLEEDDPEEEGH